MGHFTGHLQISANNQSFLDGTLLIMGDPQNFPSNMFAATSFLRGKGLHTGSLITVTGSILAPPNQGPMILMTDAVGTGP